MDASGWAPVAKRMQGGRVIRGPIKGQAQYCVRPVLLRCGSHLIASCLNDRCPDNACNNNSRSMLYS
eukprot:7230808-Pyramimonas_sp.AAC.1